MSDFVSWCRHLVPFFFMIKHDPTGAHFFFEKVLSWVQLNCLLCTCVIYHLTMIHT